MKTTTTVAALAVLALTSAACQQRKDYRTGETTITSGTEQERAKAPEQAAPAPVAEAPKQDMAPALPAEPEKTAALDDNYGKDDAKHAHDAATLSANEKSDGSSMTCKQAADLAAKKKAAALAAKKKAADEAAAANAQSDSDLSDQGSQGQMGNDQAGTTQITGVDIIVVPVRPSVSPAEMPNTSTTLGNGQSGMYTGGQGSYGGSATWGTGAGANAPNNPPPAK